LIRHKYVTVLSSKIDLGWLDNKRTDLSL